MQVNLDRAMEALDRADGEITLDFSAVRRIDASTLCAMEQLAGSAEAKAVKVVLYGVNIAVYRVLKLMKLAPRFSFRT